MEILREVLLTLHLIGMAVIVGGYFAVIRSPRVMPGMLHAAYLQLVTGLALVGLAEMGEGQVDRVKIGVKLIVAILVTVAAFIGNRRQRAAAAGGRSAVPARTGSSITAVSTGGAVDAVASARVGTGGSPAPAPATPAEDHAPASAPHPSATMAHLTFGLAIVNVLVAVFVG